MNRNFPLRSAPFLCFTLMLCAASVVAQAAQASSPAPAQVHDLKVTVLSTMLVGEQKGIGEWGFAAPVEADGHGVLVDTGARPETVL